MLNKCYQDEFTDLGMRELVEFLARHHKDFADLFKYHIHEVIDHIIEKIGSNLNYDLDTEKYYGGYELNGLDTVSGNPEWFRFEEEYAVWYIFEIEDEE